MKWWSSARFLTFALVGALGVGCGGAPKAPGDFHPSATQQTDFLSIERDAGGALGHSATDDELVSFATDSCSFMSHESYAKTNATISADLDRFRFSYKPVDVQTLIVASVKQICPEYVKKLPSHLLGVD
jgi:hypothetical protein